MVGDVRDLPFEDRSFDVVVAVDVMEHLAARDRPRALAELARVTRRRLVVAAPAGRAALKADERLAAALATRPEWLDEHLANGFPEPGDLVGPLRVHGVVQSFGNESAAAHVVLTRRELSVAWFIPTRTAARVLATAMRRGARWPGRLLHRVRGRDAEPVYRTVAVLDIAASSSASSSSASVA